MTRNLTAPSSTAARSNGRSGNMQMKDIHERAERLVRNEVYVCLSSLVSTLATGAFMEAPTDPRTGWCMTRRDLNDLCEQAFDLCSPVLDYEEAAEEAGWRCTESEGVKFWSHPDLNNSEETYKDVQILCDCERIEPHEREIFEHWSVSEHLAENLLELGERVDTDFASLCVWGRTTRGQAISMDYVIRQVLDLIEKRANAVVASFKDPDHIPFDTADGSL